MDIVATILSPVVWVMGLVLELYISVIKSVGLSIFALSFTFALALLPLRKSAEKMERRISEKMNAANRELQAIKGALKGEELFLATEKIYKKHHYHPVQSIALGAGFFVMLPVLISAILLLNGDGFLSGTRFLMIDDLSEPDHLLGPVNLLPLIMSGMTIIEARLRYKDDKNSRIRFYFIAVVLLVLVYNLASGLILYWTGSNIMSLILQMRRNQQA